MSKKFDEINLSTNFSIGTVQALIKQGEASKNRLADFVFERLTERYILPSKNVAKDFKNGFSMMANCCLLIETYECFRQGLKDTNPRRAGEKVFNDFFSRESQFIQLKVLGSEFYKNVRCGILHQGETKKGWHISRMSASLFDPTEKKINANKFLEGMYQTLIYYRAELYAAKWTDPLWTNCCAKINFIINNCKP